MIKEFLVGLLGPDNVLDRPEQLAPYREDSTEIEPGDPDLVAFVTTTEQVQAVVRKAGELQVPITPRVFATNIGGLTIPTRGGLVLDMTRMNRVLEVNVEEMYAVIEPGVTQRILKDHLLERGLPLTFGFSLAPPDTSVLANAMLGGLTNRSLKYGNQSDWVSGLEVVTADGNLLRTGAWAVQGALPFARVPMPDLSGLFFGWQGTTGIVTRLAFQLWPLHPHQLRLFYLTYSPSVTYEVMRRLCRTEICEDIGGLSWPSAKMMMGVRRPHPRPAEGEPTFFLYIDLAAETRAELAAKQEILAATFAGVVAGQQPCEGPFDVRQLVQVNPALSKFAEFPTDLEFLTAHGGGGLTWIGTYGPLSRFAAAAEAGTELMARLGVPPVIVSRPMRGGHFGVLRFITIFDKKDAGQVEQTRRVNRELLALLTEQGFLMYKTPIWAWQELRPRLDPAMLALLSRVKELLDPQGIFNPGKLGLGR